MINHLNLNRLKAVVTLFFALFLLASCGFNAKSSSDYSEEERTPHIFDKDYRSYDRAPIEVEGIDSDEDSDEENEVVIVIEDDKKGETDNQITSSIDHCIASEVNSANIINSTSHNELEAFKLALYISGSFEGTQGWKNITNNFDGQGLSLGLFQQNLGQGSLQPLLLKALSNNPQILDKHFSGQQKKLLIEMLEEWLENKGTLIASSIKSVIRSIASTTNSFTKNDAITVRDSMSVNWALNNLFKAGEKGETFKSEWKSALQSLAGDPDYINVQQEAAMVIHDRALGYMKTYDTKSLASYLFFFDIVVQNGSMRGLKYTKSLASQSEPKRLKTLMSKRVKMSRAKYQSIVLERKSLILLGQGLAQNRDRDLQEETCLTNWSEIAL